MDWREVHIRAMAFDRDRFELLFDIDYILERVPPIAGEKHFKYQVAPATLVFASVHEIRCDLWALGDLELNDLKWSEPRSDLNPGLPRRGVEWLWTLQCKEGTISFRAIGFSMEIRRVPTLSDFPRLSSEHRGGFSFNWQRTATPEA
jgi:hypothetical protein